jgi:hypothetical protein
MSTELVERLNAGIRYLPRMATEDSAEYRQFCDAGDAISVNEGDLWNALFAMREAADELTALTEALEWYGERARLARLIHSGGDPARFELSDDGGKRARRALSEPDKNET